MNAPTLQTDPVAGSSERDPLERLTDEFLQRLRRGEKPSIAEYADQHPELANEIRNVFPALLMLEQAGPQGTAGSFGLLGNGASAETAPPMIGDYKLIREIGRGAMGVVYEAQQQSLDRQVALKILPWHASSDGKSVERFRREAKAAARLHHTNIVPVFEVGQAGEVCFYTMQLIAGQSLDKVIVELRRLQRGPRRDVTAADDATPSAENLALSLHDVPPKPVDTVQLATGSTVRDPSHVSLAESGKQPYYESVVRMGRQVADALAYAHSRGVIHRDIKPSNVLLDAAGVAWVTDFGLAKTEEVGITRTGDVIGTLRYMAPERFQGECDVAADVYSLGVTLYELLVLKPPHEATQRAELIAQITQREPMPLRVIEPGIPRDLELIVLKALDREPRHRYPTAAAMAEDLRRFLADEPILGRRISPLERFARWVRHNRLLAAATITAAALLLVVAIGSTIAGARFHDLAVQEHAARVETTGNLYRSLVGEATATRLARREGFRAHAWKLLDQAQQLDSEVVNTAQLRSEALQSLGDFVGLEPLSLSDFPAEVSGIALSTDSKLLAVGLANGAIQWHEAATGKLLAQRSEHFAPVTRLQFGPDGELLAADARGVIRLWKRKQDDVWESTSLSDVRSPLLALHAQHRLTACRDEHVPTLLLLDDLNSKRRLTIESGRTIAAAAFSVDGVYLAGVSGDDIYVWQTSGGGLIKHATCTLGPLTSVSFSPDGKLLLCAGDQGSATFDLPELRQQSFTHTEQLSAAAFNPAGRLAALASDARRIVLWSVFGNREVAALSHPGWKPLHTLAFSHDQRLLASADGDSVRVWNLAGTPERLNLAGHGSGVTSLQFNPAGTRLVSTSKDRQLALWDAKSGERLAVTSLSSTMQSAAFSHDGALLAAGDGAGKLVLFNAETLIPVFNVVHSLETIHSLAFSGDGNHLVVSGKSGIQLWKVKSGKVNGKQQVDLVELKRLDVPDCRAIAISPDSQFLAWLNPQGQVGVLVLDQLAQWPCSAPRALPGDHNLAFHTDSRHLLLVDTNNQLEQWDVLADRSAAVLGDPGDVRGTNLAVGPNGRWVAVNAEPLRLSVWDLSAKQRTFQFREERSSIAATAWSSTGNRLAFGTQDGQVAIWDMLEIRKQLATIHLDWPDADFEPPKETAAASPLKSLEEALEREPKNVMLLLRRASLYLEKGETDKGLADLSSAAAADEKSEPAVVARANLYAQLGKWKEAAADAQKAVELNPESVRNWQAAAYCLAHAGASAAYQAHCQKMVERFRETTDPRVAERIARAALLMPDAVDTALLPRQVLETAVAGFGPSPVSRAEAFTTLALLEIRAGKAQSALAYIGRAQEDPAYSKTPPVQALSFLIQAVAEQAVGKPAVARETLKAAPTFLGSSPGGPQGDFIPTHATRLAFEILLPEAQRVVK
jgi:serine/threonine protein kinase/WD40 repeat protein